MAANTLQPTQLFTVQSLEAESAKNPTQQASSSSTSSTSSSTTFFQQLTADEWQREIQANQAEFEKMKEEITQSSNTDNRIDYNDEEVDEEAAEDESPIPSDEEDSGLTDQLKPRV